MTFEDWWKVYPKKVGKKLSRKIWVRDKLDLKADELIAKLEIQVKMCARYQNRQYIPDPATYLNGERWDDEIEEIVNILPRTNDDLLKYAEERNIKLIRGETYPELRQRIIKENL